MGNRITRTVLFAASALLSMCAFGAGAARFGTLRNSDWVVTNAWQAVSNKTHDLILEIGQGGSLPPNWINVSNAAMSAIQSLQPATNYTDEVALDFAEGRRAVYLADNSTFSQIATTLGDSDTAYTAQDLINESTNAATAIADTKISTNNSAFVSAVLAVPLVGADPNDLSEIAEYGSYGTVGAALLALIAGLAALKRRMASAETTISGKLDGEAAYPTWERNPVAPYPHRYVVYHNGLLWEAGEDVGDDEPGETESWAATTIKDLKQDTLTFDNSPTQNSNNPVKSGGVYAALQAKANTSDLPYALVTPGEWEFSDGQSHTVYGPTEGLSGWFYMLDDEQTGDYSNYFSTESEALAALSLTFLSVTATRASLPGVLCDRAVNAVPVSTDTTLTLPALEHAGKARDFLVRLAISGSTVPTITFAAPTGETITYETDGDEFPVPDADGTWLYSFTETAAHTFAVALKKVNVVTQGGV